MSTPIIISHAEDPDGIIAATIAAEHFHAAKEDYDLHLVTYGEQKAFFETLAKNRIYLQDKDIIISDLNTNDNLLEGSPSILEILSQYAISLTIIDHHDGTERHKEQLEHEWGVEVYSGMQDKKCSSNLALEAFDCDVPHLQYLAAIAQEHDFAEGNNQLMKTAKELQGIITLYQVTDRRLDLEQLTTILRRPSSLTEGKFNPDLQEDLDEFNHESKISYPKLLGSKTEIKSGGKTFLVGIADPIIPPKDGSRFFRENNLGEADGYFVLFKHPRNSVIFSRDPNSDFNAEPFCNFMAGGGRGGNGGFNFNVPENIHPSGLYERLQIKLDQFYR